MFISVDFPDPLAPIIAAYCPGGMRSVMSDSTGSGGDFRSCAGKVRVMRRRSIMRMFLHGDKKPLYG